MAVTNIRGKPGRLEASQEPTRAPHPADYAPPRDSITTMIIRDRGFGSGRASRIVAIRMVVWRYLRHLIFREVFWKVCRNPSPPPDGPLPNIVPHQVTGRPTLRADPCRCADSFAHSHPGWWATGPFRLLSEVDPMGVERRRNRRITRKKHATMGQDTGSANHKWGAAERARFFPKQRSWRRRMKRFAADSAAPRTH